MKKNSYQEMCQLAATSWDQSHRQTVFGQPVQRPFHCHIFGAKGSWTLVQHNPTGVKFMTALRLAGIESQILEAKRRNFGTETAAMM